MLKYHPRGGFLNIPLFFAVYAVRITENLIPRIYVRVFFFMSDPPYSTSLVQRYCCTSMSLRWPCRLPSPKPEAPELLSELLSVFMLFRGGAIVIRTHDGPKKQVAPLYVYTPHFGFDYNVPP